MSRESTAWSVKGIDQATRDIARRASQAAGMTIGEWIDHAIKSDSANRGVPVPTGSGDRDRAPPSSGSPIEGVSAGTAEAIFSRIEDGENLFEARLRPIGYALKDVAERLVALERRAAELPATDQRPQRQPIQLWPINTPTVFAPTTPLPEEPSEAGAGISPAEPTQPEPPQAEPPQADAPPAPTGEPVPDAGLSRDDESVWLPQADPLPPRPTGARPSGERPALRAVPPVRQRPNPPDGPPADWRPADELDRPGLARAAGDMPVRTAPARTESAKTTSAPPEIEGGRSRPPQEARLQEARRDPALELPPRPRPDPVPPIHDFPAEPIDTRALGLSGDPVERESAPSRRAASVGRLAIAAMIALALVGGAVWTAHHQGTLSLGAVGDRLDEAEDTVAEAVAHAVGWVRHTVGAPEPTLAEPEAPASTEPSSAESASAGPSSAGPLSAEPSPLATVSTNPPSPPAPEPAPSSDLAAAPDPTPKPAPPPLPETAIVVEPRPAMPPPAPRLAAKTSPAGEESGTGTPAEPLRRAEAGDPAAQFEVAAGMMRAAVPQPSEAAIWFREAAINGLDVAQFNLGVMYEAGRGVPRDETRALLWYHSAAEQGHPLAQYNLGRLYALGQGIPQSDAEATRWFQRAAARGVAMALHALATFETNETDREQLMYRAAKGGDPDAQAWLRARTDGGDSRVTLGPPADLVLDSPTGAPDIVAIQEGLTALGYYSGPLDGIAGPVTRAAIGKFQSDNGLPATGLPSRSLRQRLN